MKLKNFLEYFIIAAIVLVIIQTFMFEFSAYHHWSVSARDILVYCGLVFDIIFSVEFTVRSIFAIKDNRTFRRYFIYERGWVDFISSFPLLILDSGPSVYFLLSGNIHDTGSTIGVLNVLKVVKAVRVTRVLRLVRIIKIFGKIHNADSPMAQHHTSTISTTAVFTIVCSLIVFSIFTDSAGINKISDRKEKYNIILSDLSTFGGNRHIKVEELTKKLLQSDKNIIKLDYKDKHLFENISSDVFKKYYNHEDYIEIKRSNFVMLLTISDIHREIALDHIKSFTIIIFVVTSFMIFYTKHFAQNISDLIHILNKGFRKKDYNLQIKVKDEYSNQEIYKLAKFYNDAYLPAKLKRTQALKDSKKSGISMKDLMDFNK